MNNKEMTFESALNELETIVNKLETGNVNLEESLALYKKSIELYNVCNQFLNEAKKTVEIIKNENYEDSDIVSDVIID